MNSPRQLRPSRSRRVAALLAVGCALATGGHGAARGLTAAAGKRAPAFVLERPDGSELASSAFAGRPLLVNVFATWCGTCRVEEPVLSAAYAKYGARVRFLGIDEQEGVARMSAFARQTHIPYPVALDDGQFAASYDTSKIPETIVIDARGIVRAVHRGLVRAADLDRDLAHVVSTGEKDS